MVRVLEAGDGRDLGSCDLTQWNEVLGCCPLLEPGMLSMASGNMVVAPLGSVMCHHDGVQRVVDSIGSLLLSKERGVRSKGCSLTENLLLLLVIVSTLIRV